MLYKFIIKLVTIVIISIAIASSYKICMRSPCKVKITYNLYATGIFRYASTPIFGSVYVNISHISALHDDF